MPVIYLGRLEGYHCRVLQEMVLSQLFQEFAYLHSADGADIYNIFIIF